MLTHGWCKPSAARTCVFGNITLFKKNKIVRIILYLGVCQVGYLFCLSFQHWLSYWMIDCEFEQM